MRISCRSAFPSSGEASAPVVFAGYGASADEFGYDDYGGIDVKGKIVVLLRYEPAGFAAKSGNQGLTRHAALITKAINARNHGAKAVVIVNGKLGSGEEDLLTRFGSVSGPENAGIILVQVKNSVAQEWFAAAGKSLASVQKQINSASEAGLLCVSRHAASDTRREHRNDARHGEQRARLPARQDRRIRHRRRALRSSRLRKLRFARAVADRPDSSRRGRQRFGHGGRSRTRAHVRAAQGTASARNSVCVVRGRRTRAARFGGMGEGADAAARQGRRHAEHGHDRPHPGRKGVYRRRRNRIDVSADAARTRRRDFRSTSKIRPGGYASSDHTSFVAKKIPVLFFFSGLHSDYHKPSDTWDKINAPDAARLVDMVAKVALQLDESGAEAGVRHRGRARRIRMQAWPAAAEGAATALTSVRSRTSASRRTACDSATCSPDSPAAKAGLKGGDVLVKFGDKTIMNLYDFTDALRGSKVGDVVEVTVLRDGKPLKASVKLEQRR